MLTELTARGFSAVPYLEVTALMRTHGGTVRFATDRPNVIVGPNGSGKSALVDTLSLRFLTHFTARSSFDSQYLSASESTPWWSRSSDWSRDWKWLAGLTCETDNAPALYYRPQHIPGNEAGIAHAMMMGYFDEAREYARLTERKSSGEQAQALMQALLDALAGQGLPEAYGAKNWHYRETPNELARGFITDQERKAAVLKAAYHGAGGRPLVLMDEPEQSLDALAEARLWAAIRDADCSRMQVVVATHSLYPLLHPEHFHFIEATPGFVAEVRDLAT